MPFILENSLAIPHVLKITFPLVLLTLAIGYGIIIAIYNVYFHPLRRFPGPKLWAATAILAAINIMRGRPHEKILEFHKKYGDVVRIGPAQLSFAHPEAWKDVCGHLKRGQLENEKDPKVINEKLDKSVISACRERHGPLRRTLAHVFSARAMAAQQPLINKFIDLFIQRLHEQCEDGSKPLNMVKWYEWATFDIIGDLATGESFGCLENSRSHPWMVVLFEFMRTVPVMQALSDFPFSSILKPLLFTLFIPLNIIRMHRAKQFSIDRIDKRLKLGAERPDFVTAMLENGSDYKLSKEELVDNSILLTTAGSETTATTLAGVTYFLCSHPDVLAKLNAEVRLAFKSEDEIDVNSVQNLTYMHAVLKEAMRVYPAVAVALERLSPPCGTQIAGEYIAGGTSMGVWQYPLYHNPSHFLYPDSFIPERWLGDERFAKDHKEVLQPFSHGPRSCLGMNLAYMEMRLIMARLIWNFDLKLASDSKDWVKHQKVLFFWVKPPLNVYLKPRAIQRHMDE
ncbi:hypothetical protein AJ79_03375 [Helicocarpus griseus UAMH5409]|uniref:Cytochrome P450 monooxygenase n=1 Tax=Helicocarpus griseus UAMH5409 TaxID=1447875 RepID=A0A2B7XY51_9EURO|nr:hypothetical protein AJ79_03375 [Helicocarpus griseus UAMH5409]